MSLECMALFYVILITVFPWTGASVKVNVNTCAEEWEEQSPTSLHMSNGTEEQRYTNREWYDRSLSNTSVEMVYAAVYDLTDDDTLKAAGDMLRAMHGDMGGLYHVGIKAFGEEVWYGSGVDDEDREFPDTGVQITPPGSCPGHDFKEFIEIGPTTLTNREWTRLIRGFKRNPYWSADKYDMLYRNCIIFAGVFLRHLPEEFELPEWMEFALNTGQDIEATTRPILEMTRQLTGIEDIGAATRPALPVLRQLTGQFSSGLPMPAVSFSSGRSGLPSGSVSKQTLKL